MKHNRKQVYWAGTIVEMSWLAHNLIYVAAWIDGALKPMQEQIRRKQSELIEERPAKD